MVKLFNGDNMDYIKKINEDYKNVTDLNIKKIKNIYIIYLESIIDQNKINDYILKIIPKSHIPRDIKELIPSPNIKDVSDYDTLSLYLESGFTIIINRHQIIAIETRGNLSRSIDTPTTESTIYGPKEAFVENYQVNLGLIKRRIKSKHLKNKDIFIGRYTKNTASVIYIETIAEEKIYNEIIEKLEAIDRDGINDVSQLKKYLGDKTKNAFPAFKVTERPDVVAASLLEGKIVVILDNSSNALILPSFLADFINPIADHYEKAININFLKILRFLCFFLAILTPAIYVAITTYNQETIPTTILINFQEQRSKVPFSAVIECFITLIICEILRESDIRFPSSYGSATSILGALVLGEAAVAAGIVSPIMIIIVAITFISSLIFTDLEIINSIRHWRFLFLFVAAIYGIFGIGICFIALITSLTSQEVFNKPYFYPLSPFDLTYIKQTLFKMKTKKRSKLLSKNRYKEAP